MSAQVYSSTASTVLWYVSVAMAVSFCFFFFSSRRRHTRCLSDWSSDVCSSDLNVDACGSPGRDCQRHVECLRTARVPSIGADRKSTRLNSSHLGISYAVFCLQKKQYRVWVSEGEGDTEMDNLN